MSDTLQKTCKLSFGDYKHYNYQHMINWSKSKAFSLFVFGPFFFLFFTISLFYGLAIQSVLLTILGGILSTFLGILLLSTFLQTFFLKRYYTGQKSVEEKEYTFSREAVDVSNSSGKSHITWDKIYKIRESAKLLVLYISVNQGYVLPKADFTDEEMTLLKSFFPSQK